ncbi:MAG: hypothetical protein K0S93_1290 [Nitrososphaeraceae archaeon]|jgi:hypothetical protein|nr:hypothetical protein [Nitrososphaeraceae archaeon]
MIEHVRIYLLYILHFIISKYSLKLHYWIKIRSVDQIVPLIWLLLFNILYDNNIKHNF